MTYRTDNPRDPFYKPRVLLADAMMKNHELPTVPEVCIPVLRIALMKSQTTC